MNLLFETVSILFAILLQIACGSAAAFGFPFALCALLVLSMRRNAVSAVVAAFFCGIAIDIICGREFPGAAVSLPIAVAVGNVMLPEEPVRFFFGDYIMPGCAAVFTSEILQTLIPLCYGKEWYHLVQNGGGVVLATILATGFFPLWVLLSDRAAGKLEIRRIFSKTIKFALRPARR